MTRLAVHIADDELLARKRLARLLGGMPDVEVVGVHENGERLSAAIRNESCDAVFLDIRMPGMSGIELASILGRAGPPVVFVSAYREHALEAFDVGAVDYVLKPVDPARLREAVDRILGSTRRPSTRLAVHTNGSVVLVDPTVLTHCHFDGALVTLHRRDQPPLITDMSLSDIELRLPGVFERVHRRHLVALPHVEAFIKTVSGGVEALVNGHRVPVSRQASRKLRKELSIP